jgi:hypothetical protein
VIRVERAWDDTEGPIDPNRCGFCTGLLDGIRSDALYCCAAHRAEAWRLRRLLAGEPADRYDSLAAGWTLTAIRAARNGHKSAPAAYEKT